MAEGAWRITLAARTGMVAGAWRIALTVRVALAARAILDVLAALAALATLAGRDANVSVRLFCAFARSREALARHTTNATTPVIRASTANAAIHIHNLPMVKVVVFLFTDFMMVAVYETLGALLQGTEMLGVPPRPALVALTREERSSVQRSGKCMPAGLHGVRDFGHLLIL